MTSVTTAYVPVEQLAQPKIFASHFVHPDIHASQMLDPEPSPEFVIPNPIPHPAVSHEPAPFTEQVRQSAAQA